MTKNFGSIVTNVIMNYTFLWVELNVEIGVVIVLTMIYATKKVVSFVLIILLLPVTKQSFGPIKINLNPDKFLKTKTDKNFGLIVTNVVMNLILC